MHATYDRPAQPPSAPRVEWVSELRGFLALYVVLHHASMNIDHSGRRDALWSGLDAVFGWGHMRVDVFFVLSGFVLALPLVARPAFGSFTRYMLRRAARLLPTYYAACAISLLLVVWLIGERTGTHWDVSLPVTTSGVVTHLLLIHSWWPQYTVQLNHPLWSIAVEFQLGLLLPLLVYACRGIGPWKTIAAATVVGYVAWRASVPFDFPNPSPWGASLYYLSLFAMGVAGAFLYRAKAPVIRPRGTDLAVVGSIGALMVGWAFAEELRHHAVVLQVQSFFVGAVSLGLILLSRSLRDRDWGLPGVAGRVMRAIGARSYSLYLIHAPVLQLVWWYVVRPMRLGTAGLQVLWMLGLGGLAALAAGWLLFALVEQRSLAWSRKVGSDKPSG